MKHILKPGPIFLAVSTLAIEPVMAQKSGQSIQIQHGTVISSSYVQEGAGGAALVGGAIGYGLARNKSSASGSHRGRRSCGRRRKKPS